MAGQENATCPADITMTSAQGRFLLTSAGSKLTSALTGQRLGQRGPRVSGPTYQPHTEADAWDPHVSWVKRKKGVAAWFTGLKEEKAGSGWPKKLGSASWTGLVHGSSGRLGSLDQAMAHRLPLTLSLSYSWARGLFSVFH